MFLLGKPYISDFLIKTIKENNFPIIATPEAKKMISEDAINWISEEDAKETILKNQGVSLYTNSENTISWVEKNLGTTKFPNQINVFKNKIKFRELLKDTFPNYFFKGVKFEELNTVSIDSLKFPLIIKPAVGFFSLGVHKVDNSNEWNETLTKLKCEINDIKGFYPNEVLDTSYFIIEECIEGEEYAVDCYFDNEGKPVVLNIMHHVFSSGKDVSDRVYTTSKIILESTMPSVENFLEIVGKKMNLTNFPIHVEVRITIGGTVIPIEVNPMRFGGLCTTGDISWFAYGINSYEYFLKGIKPNWKEILKTRKDKLYSIVLLDNNSGYSASEIASFDYEQVLKDFERPMSLRKMDFNEYPIFGILFTETTVGNEKELQQILTSDMRKYIRLKN